MAILLNLVKIIVGRSCDKFDVHANLLSKIQETLFNVGVGDPTCRAYGLCQLIYQKCALLLFNSREAR